MPTAPRIPAAAPLRLGLVLAMSLALPTSVVVAGDAPERMPGLWEIVVTTPGAAHPERNFHICVAQGADDVLAQVEAEPGVACGTQAWRRDNDRWKVEDACHGERGEWRRHGVFGGDFHYNFQGDLTIEDPAGRRVLQVDGRRLAPCRTLKPGEFVIKGENGVNLNRVP